MKKEISGKAENKAKLRNAQSHQLSATNTKKTNVSCQRFKILNEFPVFLVLDCRSVCVFVRRLQRCFFNGFIKTRAWRSGIRILNLKSQKLKITWLVSTLPKTLRCHLLLVLLLLLFALSLCLLFCFQASKQQQRNVQSFNKFRDVNRRQRKLLQPKMHRCDWKGIYVIKQNIRSGHLKTMRKDPKKNNNKTRRKMRAKWDTLSVCVCCASQQSRIVNEWNL